MEIWISQSRNPWSEAEIRLKVDKTVTESYEVKDICVVGTSDWKLGRLEDLAVDQSC